MPIKGRIKEELTMNSVLERVSEYSIYRHFFGDFDLNQVTCNHLRGDNSPSFIIGNKYGTISHFDFADSYWRGDCFSLVKQIYGLSTLNEVLEKIDSEMGLGIRGIKKDYEKVISTYKQPEITKRNTLIQVVTRKFTKEELQYWNQYHQDIEDLKKNNIYSVKTIYLNKQKFALKDTDLRFGYFYEGYWKIYRPFNNKKEKWMPNNVPITMMDGKENIKNCKIAFVNKSKKDKMVIEKIFPCSCAVQNEGIACFSEENVKYLKDNSKRQILSFDADSTGVKNSIEITNLFGFDYCNVPKRYLSEGIKDWSDLAKAYGLDTIEEILKRKEII